MALYFYFVVSVWPLLLLRLLAAINKKVANRTRKTNKAIKLKEKFLKKFQVFTF